MQADPGGVKFGPFRLMPGITRINACTFFFSSFMFVTLVTFLNFVQPYILDEVLRVPAEQQGRVTGALNFVHESIALIVMAFVGALSDRTGRRALMLVGLGIWIVGFLLFPTADGIAQLYLYRIVIAVGVATTSVTVIAAMQDYPQEVSRGKWGGVNSFNTSFAILAVSLLLVRLPGWLTDGGMDAVRAGRWTFWIGAAMAFVAAIVIRFGLYGGRIGQSTEKSGWFAGVADGFRAARSNPRLALAYGGAFAARGDLVVVGAFFSLWFVRAGAEQGISSADAIIRSGITMPALLLANWIWAPAFGFVLDRINRVFGLCIAMTLAAIGYFAIAWIENPYDMPAMMTATFVLGIGEISAVVAGNALLGQEAPARIRGAAVGVFGLVGTMGILFATLLGGRVFDVIGYGAPFGMMAGVNAIVAVWALLVFSRAAGPRPEIGPE
ncbi:MAG: MFS transporter [Gammaproteobacteria bacterium]